MLKSLQQLWSDAKTPTDFIITMWIYLLFVLFTISWTSLVFGIVTGQVDLSNATFGIFDTLG
jgi:hypothetical protein